MPYVVGITGRAGSGKDTLATLLRQKLCGMGYSAYIFSFAAPIRIIAAGVGLDPYCRTAKEKEIVLRFNDFKDCLIGVIDFELHDEEDNRKAELFSFFVDDLYGAGFLQSHESGDTLTISPRVFMQMLGTAGRKVHPRFWITRIGNAINKAKVDIVIISDVRFWNEATLTNKLVGRVGLGTPVAAHESENHLESLLAQCSTVVDYCTDLADLEGRAHSIAVHTGYRRDRTQDNPQAFAKWLYHSQPLIKS